MSIPMERNNMNMYIVMLNVDSVVPKYTTISSSAGRNISVDNGANMLRSTMSTINIPSDIFMITIDG